MGKKKRFCRAIIHRLLYVIRFLACGSKARRREIAEFRTRSFSAGGKHVFQQSAQGLGNYDNGILTSFQRHWVISGRSTMVEEAD